MEFRTPQQLPQTAVIQGTDLMMVQAPNGPVHGVQVARVIGRLGPVDVVVQNFADLTLAWDPGKLAIVWGDPDPAKLGYWVKTGANGAGGWVYSNVFRGFPGEDGAAGTKYRFGGSIEAAPAAGEVLMRHVFQADVSFPDDFAGSRARRAPGVAAPGADQVLPIKLDGAEVGTLTVAAAGAVTFATSAGALDVDAGQELRLEAPAAAPAAQLLGLSWVFAGSES